MSTSIICIKCSLHFVIFLVERVIVPGCQKEKKKKEKNENIVLLKNTMHTSQQYFFFYSYLNTFSIDILQKQKKLKLGYIQQLSAVKLL